jgi:carboxymethylenebutenolidase
MNGIQTKEIDVEVEGKRLSGYLARPAKPGRGVMVLHAWWGLNSFFKQVCDRLGEEGFLAFAPDLMNGKVASTIEEAKKLQAEGDNEAAQATALIAVAWMREQVLAQGDASLAQKGLGLVGFSMGGYWAVALSSLAPDDVSAAVLFYGEGDADYSTVRARFQGHFGGKDEWTEDFWVNKMKAGMQAAGLKTVFYDYPQAGHWFFESDRPDAYRPEDSDLAWERTLEFLKE